MWLRSRTDYEDEKIQQMMQRAQALQQRLDGEMDDLLFEGVAGGSTLRVVMNGKKYVDSVTIDPQAVDPEDIVLLQDLIARDFNDASKEVDDKLAEHAGRLGGSLF